MNDINKFELIEGIFNPADAMEILLGLVDYKIQYHNLKIFGEEERFGVRNEHSATRIKQLQEAREQILQLIKASEQTGKELVVSSIISIGTAS